MSSDISLDQRIWNFAKEFWAHLTERTFSPLDMLIVLSILAATKGTPQWTTGGLLVAWVVAKFIRAI